MYGFEEQNFLLCPRCGKPPVRIIMEVDKPTKYYHARNNQSDLIHEDLSVDLEVGHASPEA